MKLNYYIYSFIASLMLAFTACTPEDFDLGAKSVTADDLVEGIAYTITHDSENPNIVYLESKMPNSYTALWEHPQGRSQEKKVTLRIPFEGTYTVTFGVETRGGAVYGEPVTFKVDEFCADFVSGEMWEFLAGGSGNSKTWIPDNGNYGMKQGFYSCFDPTTTYLDMVSDNGTNWTAKDKAWWEPANADVDITEDDLNSFMTFSLEGKAGLTVHRFTDGQETVTEGLFSMDTDNHTISAVDVDFVHGEWATPNAVDFRNGFQILVLTENQLMIGNYRDEVLSGENRCVYCWNFVSKEYADNYVPEPEEPEPTEPQLPDGWKDDVSETVSIVTSSTIKWTLSTKNPVDWASQSGKLLNGWSLPSDYPDWLGVLDPAVYEDFSMTLDSKALQATFTAADGSETAMPYTLDDKGIYTFNGTVPTVTVVGWMTFRASDAGTLRILSIEKDNEDNLSGMWLGIPNPDKPDTEYIAYHFIPTAVGGGGATDKNALIKERLTGGSSRTYRLDYEHIICTWATNWGYDNITDGKKANYASSTMPDWTGWTYSASNIANVDKFRLTFGADGSLVFVNNKGESTTTTYSYLSADDWYDMPLVQFPEDLDMLFELTGNDGGWLNFELQFNKETTNDDGSVTPPVNGVPQGGGFLELYDWDLDASGKVTGLWLGMDNGNGAASLMNVANQRKVFHLIVE